MIEIEYELLIYLVGEENRPYTDEQVHKTYAEAEEKAWKIIGDGVRIERAHGIGFFGPHRIYRVRVRVRRDSDATLEEYEAMQEVMESEVLMGTA